MKNVFICTIIALMAISGGLYAQEKAQEEPVSPQTGEINPVRDSVQKDEAFSNWVKLELVWEKEIPSSIKDDWPYPGDLVFLDENGYNVFSSQCKDPEKALKEKRLLIVQKGKLKLLHGDEMRVIKDTEIKGTYAISKNGHNIAVLDGLTLHLLDWQGNELAQGKMIGGGEENHLYPLGNDQTIAVSSVWGDGRFHEIAVYVRVGKELKKVFGKEGKYPTGLFDYAEDGSTIFFIYNDKPVDGKSNIGERIVLNGAGREITRYMYRHPGWVGWVSPRGNYLVEVTRGKYLVIRDKDGKLIADHHVQGQGNYYAAFSSDENYLCVTPGPWRIYLFETEDGKMIWNYLDTNEESHFSSVGVVSSTLLVFAGHSEAIMKPGEFKGTIDELNKKVIENATKDRTIYIIKNGEFFKSIGPFSGKGFGTQLQAPVIRLSAKGKFLLVQTPVKSFIYRIYFGGER